MVSERYAELQGGLNKMAVGRFQALLRVQPDLRHGAELPVVREFFATGVRAIWVRE